MRQKSQSASRRQLDRAEEDPGPAQEREKDRPGPVEGVHQGLAEPGPGPTRPAADVFVEKPGDQETEAERE